MVNQFQDTEQEQRTLYRPLGGGIEFGERSADAIAREVQEELGLSIHGIRLLGTLESLFTHAGKPGHEIVQVYNATFDDADVYERNEIQGHESDGAAFQAKWCDTTNFSPASPLVPEGLEDLLKSLSLLK